MGESNKSSAIPLRDQGMTLSDVLGESEGLIHTRQVQLVFMSCVQIYKQKSTIYQLNLSSIGNLALSNQFQMQK